ncbi:MAG: serine/threonine-protein phosphatase [bacterium]|nr:serine/threonine-protein phosphatase [bacterium]
MRSKNEDALTVEPTPAGREESHGQLLLVADGIGGHAAGDIASNLAIKYTRDYYYKSDLNPNEDPGMNLRRAFRFASDSIVHDASKNIHHFGMGTTCSGVVIRGDQFWYCHVGDSRIYRYRGGQLSRLTRDHTLVNIMLESGEINKQEAAKLQCKHILTYAMGKEEKFELDFNDHPFPFLEGDRILISSDGLHSVVRNDVIASILQVQDDQEAVDALVAEALAEGGPDNISIIIATRHNQ